MKTHELAYIFEFLAKILRDMPNLEVRESIKDIPELLQENSYQKSDPPEISIGIDAEIANMSPKQLEDFFKNNPNGKKLTNLQLSSIASKFGLTTSKRQSREALINQLVRFVESNNLDAIIRKARNDAKNENPLLSEPD